MTTERAPACPSVPQRARAAPRGARHAPEHTHNLTAPRSPRQGLLVLRDAQPLVPGVRRGGGPVKRGERRERRAVIRAARRTICGDYEVVAVLLAPHRRGQDLRGVDALWCMTAGGPTVDQRHLAVMAHLRNLDPERLP